MDWTARVRRALADAGHGPDEEIVEELAQHAGAIYDTARADGAERAEAEARVAQQIAIWCAEAPRLKRRARRMPAVTVPPSESSRLVGLVQDARYGLRLLAQRPGGTLVAVITMALGIAATTVLFSVAWSVLFKPLPLPDADRLVRVSETRQGSTRGLPPILTNGTYLAWRDAPATIESLGAWAPGTVTLTGAGDPQRLRVVSITPSVFELLRTRPEIGSPFTEGPASPGGDTAIILSHTLWRQRFGGTPDVLGRTIHVDGEPRTVVGVMPREFNFPDPDVRAWTPLRVHPVVGDNGSRYISLFSAMARLKPGATPAQAAAEATARARSAPDPGLTAIAIFGSRGPVDVSAVPALELMTGEVRQPLMVFLAAVALLLATATANIASVQLARSTTRRREIAIRSALGAGSGRLARQLLIENLLLGLVGGAAGLAAAAWLHRILPSILPADFPRVSEISLDFRVMAFALAVTVMASIAFGLLPALHVRRVNLVEALTEDSQAPVGGSARTRTARARALIMAGQVAVASVLLIGASLLIRSFVAMLNADRGYDVANVLTARLPLPPSSYTGVRRAGLVDSVLARLRATPGVTGAAMTTVLPLGSSESRLAFTMPGPDRNAEPRQIQAGMRVISPDYFSALGMRLAEGRTLAAADTKTSLPVIVVNRSFVQRYLDGPPLGRRIPAGLDTDKNDWEIVGVVDDVRMRGVTDPPLPEIFVSYAQISAGITSSDPTLVVRTAGDPTGLVQPLRDIVRIEDGSLALDSIVTMEQKLLGNLARPRLYAIMLGGFAAVALAIAAVGLFGVLSYSVAQRSREIAVRSALGARQWDIVALVLRQGLLITGVGLVAGIGAAIALTRWMASFLYGVTVHDRLTFVAVPILLLIVAAAACFVPARRAARLDPLKVLKAG